ncbi:MAG: PRC-barrel domain-containing protein [Pseudorhodoplanes sp.]
MRQKTGFVATTLLACALAVPAYAQAPRDPAPADRNAATQAAPVPASGQWRASKLIGVNVYNAQNEKLGEINELILNSSGQVAGAVIGVGGFLGMGEHDVMVPLDRLKFANEARNNTTGSGASNKQWYPDRAVLSANKDQLKAMPQFKY